VKGRERNAAAAPVLARIYPAGSDLPSDWWSARGESGCEIEGVSVVFGGRSVVRRVGDHWRVSVDRRGSSETPFVTVKGPALRFCWRTFIRFVDEHGETSMDCFPASTEVLGG